MPVSLLNQCDLTQDAFDGEDWHGADLGGESLREATFQGCDFSGVNFDGADLTNTTFQDCQFSGANPELAASLDGTRLLVEGLSPEQLAVCAARGAIVTDDEED